LEGFQDARRQIAAKVRELRRSRHWTQAELSEHLQLSQSRLSELERGAGSFTAEQFLLLLRLFNVAASDFVSLPGEPELRIQNALARLGATQLWESRNVLPSQQLEDAHDVMREALVDGDPRMVTALAPVLVRSERLNLPKLYAELERLGLERRLVWAIENTLAALELLRQEAGAREWPRSERISELQLQLFLRLVTSLDRGGDARVAPPDLLETTIRSERSLREVQSSSSAISQRWGIVTSLQPEDFVQALKAAGVGR
jgi:transcriptional regulator with XRE-family HTH domain